MTTGTVLLLLLSLVVAAGLSFFQYFFKAGRRNRTNLILAVLRFVSIFGLLLLLINPVISSTNFETEKTPLPIVLDNSSSVKVLKADGTAQSVWKQLTEDRRLSDKFDVQPYQFDTEFSLLESPDFKGRQSDMETVSRSLASIYKNKTFPTVLVTDGNQTKGNDYVYTFSPANKVFPVVLGDTTTFLDLRVARVNANKYAFHKNKFPVEVFLQYSGTKNISADFTISSGNTVLEKQSVVFSPDSKSAVVNVLLPANNTGLQVFTAALTSKETEKNTYNNRQRFAVEVIDQRTEVAIVASLNHPDIGALKRSIETNAQRKVSIIKPLEIKSLQDFNILILYQPDASFRQVYELNKLARLNTFTITGMNTDFGFLGQQQSHFQFRMSGQPEDYLATFSTEFNLFAIDDIGFANFPPLQHPFGTPKPNGNTNVLLGSRIRNVALDQPLLAFNEEKGSRSAMLFGENIWKWRMQSHLDNRSFEKFDLFVDKIVQFLATNDKKRSLVVTHESFYNAGDAIEITAQYFNKNYEFDDKARLTLSVTNKETKQSKSYDLLKRANNFKANLDGLPAGKYNFSVKELNSNTVYNGYFEILDFDIEQQFVNPDLVRLNQLAAQTQGSTVMPDQLESLIKTLLEDQQYRAVQKSVTRKVPLIDWVWLLAIIAASLAAEWFIRKYNGLL